MRLNALPAAPLLPLIISCLTLSCHANSKAHSHDDALRAATKLSSSRQLPCQRRDMTTSSMATSRNFVGAFLSAASPPMHNVRRNEILFSLSRQKNNVNYSHSSSLRSGHSFPFTGYKRSFPRMRFLHSFVSDGNSYNAQDEIESGDEEHQQGMDEAFASLDVLTPEDLDGNSGGKDNESNLKYSRTDDTPASDFGKSTEEEVRHYLEMQGELEGTAVSPSSQVEPDEIIVQENNLVELAIDEMGTVAMDNYDDILSDNSQEYPWTSINPILRVRGPVASGYGRGGKKLGVPTANLPASLFQSALEDVTNGVYFGWAVIEQPPSNNPSSKKGRNAPIKAVVNVGYSPTFEGKENKEKIVEAHLITTRSPMEKPDFSMTAAAFHDEEFHVDGVDDVEIEEDFYNEILRLQLIGYLRPEQKFDSFPDLIAQIHRDIGNAHWALDTMPFIFSKEDEFVKDGVDWVGSGGGDEVASWEFESW